MGLRHGSRPNPWIKCWKAFTIAQHGGWLVCTPSSLMGSGSTHRWRKPSRQHPFTQWTCILHAGGQVCWHLLGRGLSMICAERLRDSQGLPPRLRSGGINTSFVFFPQNGGYFHLCLIVVEVIHSKIMQSLGEDWAGGQGSITHSYQPSQPHRWPVTHTHQ